MIINGRAVFTFIVYDVKKQMSNLIDLCFVFFDVMVYEHKYLHIIVCFVHVYWCVRWVFFVERRAEPAARGCGGGWAVYCFVYAAGGSRPLWGARSRREGGIICFTNWGLLAIIYTGLCLLCISPGSQIIKRSLSEEERVSAGPLCAERGRRMLFVLTLEVYI